MEKLNLPPFVVGDRVVAIESHSQGIFKKGDQFIINNIYKDCCGFTVNIGIKSSTMFYKCPDCGRIGASQFEWGFCSTMFAPIQESKFRAVTFEKVMEENEAFSVN